MKSLAAKNQRGFTLVEIMIVVLIISILLSIAVPSFIHARETSRGKACIGQLRNIMYAKEYWAAETGAAVTTTPTMAQLMAGYLKEAPECPASGNYDINDLEHYPTCTYGGVHQL
ncbi:MAG: prepilin-type N-terminal cleavage/methylation domain-containing protein [Armatimonadetes bacterium]|nr:prepilin-type N-terminal cleavage/methylation domain-containing protein [Armatimonadota bacterium]